MKAQHYATALFVARLLLSEGDENPEYDRGIVELLADLFDPSGLGMDTSVPQVRADLGVS